MAEGRAGACRPEYSCYALCSILSFSSDITARGVQKGLSFTQLSRCVVRSGVAHPSRSSAKLILPPPPTLMILQLIERCRYDYKPPTYEGTELWMKPPSSSKAELAGRRYVLIGMGGVDDSAKKYRASDD